MNTLNLNRNLPLNDSWDVIVAGGGPAGCTAAVAGAREGKKTLLIEATGILGGMGTSGLIPAWCPFSDKQGNFLYRGLAERVFRESRKGVPHLPADHLDWAAINPEQLKRVYDDLLTEAGVTVLFNTFISAVETGANGNIDAIIVSNKGGLLAYRAKVYADCTGDADLAAWAGAEFQKGDDNTHEMQPATHCFAIANVDEYAYRHLKPNSGELFRKIFESGRYPDIQDRHFCNNLIGPGTVGFNSGHLWDVDNTDPANLSQAMLRGRKIAAQFRDALAEFWPAAFGNGYLVMSSPLMGIRETRRIMGDYVLTVEDYIARRDFPDEICRSNYWIDVHTSKAEIERNRGGEEVCPNRFEHYGPGESHGVPYRCLTPKGLKNVLVAGRSISTDHPAQGAVRVMPVCLAMGEAAGLAAAYAADQAEPDVHTVDTDKLREALRGYGQFLPE